MQNSADVYYNEVGSYYDVDAPEFEERYWKNPVLQRIRADFRTYVHKETFTNALEIGFGSGLDLAHFARCYPERNFYGIDISQEMVGLANAKKNHYNLQNLQVAQGSVENVSSIFNQQNFDMIYVFFGALNTVKDLQIAANELEKLLAPNGKMVLTFVNKWYIAGMLIEFAKLRWKSAFSRLKPVWGCYSPSRYLASTCYAPSDIKNVFSKFRIVQKEGYSILHPAWYYIRFNILLKNKGRWLMWKIDKLLNKTIFWKWGEYALYVIKK